jgi:hypothetical protein
VPHVRPERANVAWFSFVPPVESSYRRADPAPSGTVFDLSYGFNAGNGDNGDVVSISSSRAHAYSRSYAYDGDGNRVKKSSGTLYRYGSGSGVLEETTPSGTATNDYIPTDAKGNKKPSSAHHEYPD